MKTEFPNYKLSKKEHQVVTHLEKQSGFDLIGAEEVKDKKSFIVCIKLNHRWLGDWVNDVVKGSERELRKLPYYMKVVLN